MNRHKPFIVELTGTPEAGKTTTVDIIYKQLIDLGYKVRIYPESAALVPKFIPKGSKEFKLWIDADTFRYLIEAPLLTDYDIVIFDRGAYDRIFWIYLDAIENFKLSLDLAPFGRLAKDYPPDLLITLFVSDEGSINRKGGEGRIVTREFIRNYNTLLKSFINSISDNVNNVFVITDNLSIEEVTSTVLNSILENMKKGPSS